MKREIEIMRNLHMVTVNEPESFSLNNLGEPDWTTAGWDVWLRGGSESVARPEGEQGSLKAARCKGKSESKDGGNGGAVKAANRPQPSLQQAWVVRPTNGNPFFVKGISWW